MYQPLHDPVEVGSAYEPLVVVQDMPQPRFTYGERSIPNSWLVASFVVGMAVMSLVLYAMWSPLARL